MRFDVASVRRCLKSFDFQTLFREHLGWDNYKGSLDVCVDGNTAVLTAVAQKRGFVAFVYPAIPDRTTRLKIDHRVTKSIREHFVIYSDKAAGLQIWHWVRREPGKPLASRDHRFYASQSGDPLIQRLNQIAVSLDEEEEITVVDVASRARAAFDVDRVTRRFYDRFKAEHSLFLKLIKGINSGEDLKWYTSLMLNRLMFVYFIQKKGFLDGDVDYLRNRLAMLQKVRGKDKFHPFYRYFLLQLFHEGLGKSPDERESNPALEKLLGRVPFLNGGFFEIHELEERWGTIDIPDRAFEKLFDFFDQYSWHLDERPVHADNEINPDVVGYIFEKYVNQKQMGAYYTKEDITEYISKNTVIPFLFGAAREQCTAAFNSNSALWHLLRDDPDRYIYPAVGHGICWKYDRTDHREHKRLEHPVPLPADIEAGISDDAKRQGWSTPPPEDVALPKETWREVIERRRRCLEIREKLLVGEIHEINDLVTLNLNLWQFARDVIAGSEAPELLRAFWNAIERVTILDPTCGSGAFLFAALRILEPLYSDCLERMLRFIQDLAGNTHKLDQFSDFKKILDQIGEHPNERYFILKSIIINNLFGVDIMEEAIEICKLRLFLKLVAQVETVEQIEPLPDIDFNIRAGNALVGYASLDQVRKSQEGELGFGGCEVKRIEEEADLVEGAFSWFRSQQITQGGRVTYQGKRELRNRLAKLTNQLDIFLAGEYGVKLQKPTELEAWRKSHQPLHWFAEYYGIMRAGGFDVIIGNPPYVSARRVREQYNVRNFATADCPDVYAWVLERVSQLLSDTGHSGMICPLSLGFSENFRSCRNLLFEHYRHNWFSSFGRIPSALFSFDVRVRNTIHLGGNNSGTATSYTTRLHRWFDESRPALFPTIVYSEFDPRYWDRRVPKLNTTRLIKAFEECAARGRPFGGGLRDRRTRVSMHYKKTAYNWLNFCRLLPPCYDAQGRQVAHTKFGEIYFNESDDRDIAFLLLNGKLQFAFWVAVGDDFDVTKWSFSEFPLDPRRVSTKTRRQLLDLVPELEAAMVRATSFKLNAGRRVGNYNLARCRHITDRSDEMFAKEFGFEKVWDDIELLYAQMVRTEFEENEE